MRLPSARTTAFRLASRSILAAIAVMTLGACDFPTEPPKIQTRFVVPGESTTLSVNQLLPGSVTVVGNSFRLNLTPPAPFVRTLGEMCGLQCAALQGFTVPKPAFGDQFQVTIALPGDVSSATLTAGSVNVVLSHNFGFDPLRPSGSTTNGTLAITVRNGTRIIGSSTIDQAFPSGSTINRAIPLAAGELAGNITVDVVLNSPAGGPVTINNNAALSVAVVPGNIDLSEARVGVQNRQVDVQAVTLDLEDVDFADQVRGGGITINMNNPFGVTGTMQLRLQGNGVNITKTIQVAANQSTQRIEFTEAELQSMMGKTVQLSISGPLSATGGNAVVRPGQELTITTRLDLLLEIG